MHEAVGKCRPRPKPDRHRHRHDTWARALEQGKPTGQKPSLPGRPVNDWETLYWGAEAT